MSQIQTTEDQVQPHPLSFRLAEREKLELGRLKLAWRWVPCVHPLGGRSAMGGDMVEVYVPAMSRHQGGTWHIWLVQRPYYCDRGRWHCCVDGVGVELDQQEGFPRYFFSLQYALEEMEQWYQVREKAWVGIGKTLEGGIVRMRRGGHS